MITVTDYNHCGVINFLAFKLLFQSTTLALSLGVASYFQHSENLLQERNLEILTITQDNISHALPAFLKDGKTFSEIPSISCSRSGNILNINFTESDLLLPSSGL